MAAPEAVAKRLSFQHEQQQQQQQMMMAEPEAEVTDAAQALEELRRCVGMDNEIETGKFELFFGPFALVPAPFPSISCNAM